MKKSALCFILFVIILLCPLTVISAQQNPFLSDGIHENKPASQVPADAGKPETEIKRQSRFMEWTGDLQRSMYEGLAAAMQRVKEAEGSRTVLLIVIALSFCYGAVHALGPGHRKTVLFSYFLAEEVPPVWGIYAGVMMGLLHGAAAAALILPFYYFLRAPLLAAFNTMSRSIETATFAFIALFGGTMLVLRITGLLIRSKKVKGEHSIAARRNSTRSNTARRNSTRLNTTRPGTHASSRTLLLIIGSSLVPCPGAAMILLFSISLQMTGVGLLAVASMSAGMALTLSMVAVVTLRARTVLLRREGRGHKLGVLMHHTLEICGYLIITMFGVLMTLGMV